MRRIDLIAKLVAPLFISLIDALSRTEALWVILGSSLGSVLIEYLAIAQVYRAVPELARSTDAEISLNQAIEPMDVQEAPVSQPKSNLRRISSWFRSGLSPWSYYAQSSVFLASLSLCILYLTVLSFNAQMITYLLDSGFAALWVSGFRLVSVVAELSATWAAPVLISRIGPVRSGLWFITWQFSCAAAGVCVFDQMALDQRLRTLALIFGVLLSRVGLWGYDLSVQYLVQDVSIQVRLLFPHPELSIGDLAQSPLAVLCNGSRPPEPIRDAIFRHNINFLTARAVQISCTDQCRSHRNCEHMLHSVCKENSRSSIPQVQMHNETEIQQNR